jgi:hypothetical protein
MSTIEAFRSLNYTILFANGPMEAYLIYSHMPDMVKTVIFEPLWGDQCYERNNDTYLDSEDEETDATWQTGEKGCGRRVGFEQGIPLWKSFHYHFWTGPSGPLGHTWTLAPEDWEFRRGGHENQYLGEWWLMEMTPEKLAPSQTSNQKRTQLAGAERVNQSTTDSALGLPFRC